MSSFIIWITYHCVYGYNIGALATASGVLALRYDTLIPLWCTIDGLSKKGILGFSGERVCFIVFLSIRCTYPKKKVGKELKENDESKISPYKFIQQAFNDEMAQV